MNQARENILKRLREGHPFSPAVPVGDFSAVAERRWTPAEKLDRFQRKIESVHGEVHRLPAERWIPELMGLLVEKRLTSLLVSDRKPHGLALREQWRDGWPSLLAYDRPIEDWQDRLFNEVDAALTGCRGAIAETGSLILWPDTDEPRLMSLVPPVHCVLLKANEIYGTFHEAIRAQGWAAQSLPANALLISGPSKTADIEQTLAYGVHGPKELLVLVLE